MRDRQEQTENTEPREVVIPIVEEGTKAAPEPAGTEATEEVEMLREKWLRSAAELDNLRKRTARDIDTAKARERENLLRSFLDVLDNLERALDSHGGESNPWLDGLEAIQQQMLGVLKTWGAAPFDSMGEMFDPNRHSAVATVRLQDKEPGRIVDVTQVGYAMGDGTILRPAHVIVVQ